MKTWSFMVWQRPVVRFLVVPLAQPCVGRKRVKQAMLKLSYGTLVQILSMYIVILPTKARLAAQKISNLMSLYHGLLKKDGELKILNHHHWIK